MSDSSDTDSSDRRCLDEGRLEFVRHWRRIGPLLEQVRNQELRAMDPLTSREVIDSLLQLADEAPAARPTSGLVEQQRLFQKWRR